MRTISTCKIVLLATTAAIAFSGAVNAQSTTEKSTVAAPVADPAAKADPDMAKVLACARPHSDRSRSKR